MSDELLVKMRLHHARIPSLKWQYYGNEHGTLYTYPAVGTCGVTNYDPRIRHAPSNVHFCPYPFLFFVLILFYFTVSFTFGYMRMARKVKAA